MVKSKTSLNKAFHALADPTRRDILKRLSERSFTVTRLADDYAISLPAVSKHLKVLHGASLIRRHRNGRKQLITLNPRGLKQVADYSAFYAKFWNKQLDNLETYLRKEVKQHGKRSQSKPRD